MEINTIEWITPSGNIGRVRELGNFSFQLSAQLTAESPDVGQPVSFQLDHGVFPMNLTLSTQGLISGQVIDMDEYVPQFIAENPEKILRDGSSYGTTGSAQAQVYECAFTVNAIYEDLIEPREFSITVINNYSSDRDQMIRNYSEAFGDFQIDSEEVDAEAYLQIQKSRGFFI